MRSKRATQPVEADAEVLRELGFLQWLKDEAGHIAPRPLVGGRYASILGFLYTFAIVSGRIGDTIGYDDRWCYSSLADALTALDAWDGNGEPTGWHRHPATGRRRPDGDELREYVNP